ncbi:MAG: hypothetical protein J7M40_08580 [Planctomycetes bacterium]|nr:hypothetical protein [Planctomycetota bacterium]
MRDYLTFAVMLSVVLGGCSQRRPSGEAVMEPESPLRNLCDAGRYHEAMRAIPDVMDAWARYTAATGRTAEGAAGYVYTTTIFTIAQRGDADWGKILDDPEIPYIYKTDMIFEIVEARLGKGAVYLGNRTNIIIPRFGRIDLDKEMIRLAE